MKQMNDLATDQIAISDNSPEELKTLSEVIAITVD